MLHVNKLQKTVLLPKIEHYFKGNISGKKIAIWGLAFKPETDDIREAPALIIIDKLLEKGAKITAFDPEAMQKVRQKIGDAITYAPTMYNALEDADALIICTEWSIFRTPDFQKVKQKLRNPAIFDGRNLYDIEDIKNEQIHYFSIGRTDIA